MRGVPSYGPTLADSSVLAVSCCLLVLLCVLFLAIVDGVRLRYHWPTRGLFLLSAFGADALFCGLLDEGFIALPGAWGSQFQVGLEQLLFLWQPFLLMLYYVHVASREFRRRMLWILGFDVGLALLETALFFLLPQERVVVEVFALFMLFVSSLVVVWTIFEWHGRARDYHRIYWETAALLALFVGSLTRFAGKEHFVHLGRYAAALRISGVAVFMVTMTVIQLFAILLEFRDIVRRRDQAIQEHAAELAIARGEAERANRKAERLAEEAERRAVPAAAAEAPGIRGAAPPEGLPTVEGLDWAYAWLHLPEEGLLTGSLRDFRELLPSQGEKLERFFAAGDRENYRIQVHGMKSSAAIVGIVPLAGTAALLEAAAREGRWEEVCSVHPTFIRAWRSYEDKLQGLEGEDGAATAKAAEEADVSPGTARDPEVLAAMLGLVQSSMEELDIDAADAAVAELKKMDLAGEDLTRLKELRAAVADLDSDASREITEAWILALGGELHEGDVDR